jgi:hypothetical protein
VPDAYDDVQLAVLEPAPAASSVGATVHSSCAPCSCSSGVESMPASFLIMRAAASGRTIDR